MLGGSPAFPIARPDLPATSEARSRAKISAGRNLCGMRALRALLSRTFDRPPLRTFWAFLVRRSEPREPHAPKADWIRNAEGAVVLPELTALSAARLLSFPGVVVAFSFDHRSEAVHRQVAAMGAALSSEFAAGGRVSLVTYDSGSPNRGSLHFDQEAVLRASALALLYIAMAQCCSGTRRVQSISENSAQSAPKVWSNPGQSRRARHMSLPGLGRVRPKLARDWQRSARCREKQIGRARPKLP